MVMFDCGQAVPIACRYNNVEFMGKALLLFIVFLPFAVFSQVAITGKVVSQAGNKPVAGATVFLSNTTIGSKAAPVNGIFALKNIGLVIMIW